MHGSLTWQTECPLVEASKRRAHPIHPSIWPSNPSPIPIPSLPAPPNRRRHGGRLSILAAAAATNQARPPDPSIPTPPHPTGGGMAAASPSSPLPAAAAATGSPRPASAEEEGRMVVSSPPSAPLAATAAAGSPHPAYPEMIKEAMTDLGRDRAAQFFLFLFTPFTEWCSRQTTCATRLRCRLLRPV